MAFSRREFLKLGGLTAGSIAASRLGFQLIKAESSLGRVTYHDKDSSKETISVFDLPRLDANTVGYRSRDTLLEIEYSLRPLAGPPYNPLWHKIDEGYVHSAFVQLVRNEPNVPVESVPQNGRLFRVTVPMTTPYNKSQAGGWKPLGLFLLYYDTNHWVTDVVTGPDGKPWYEITEAWEGVKYFADASALKAIPDSDFEHISPNLSASQKHIETSLAAQQLTAYENEEIVLRIPISSGVRNSGGAGLPTETPTGTFYIYSKLPAKYMGDSRLTDTLGDRYLPGVPWTMFFIEGGYAIHGAYWHNNFGAPMSRGCINVRPDHAQWLYRWTLPSAGPTDWEVPAQGTRVVVS